MIAKVRRFIGENKLIQRFFNCGDTYTIYDRKKIICGAQFINYFVTKDGVKYKVDGLSNIMLLETRTEYDWSDMRPDDIVLDLGSNTGGFAITAAKYVKHVYAVEPLWGDYIKEHIKLNNYNNVTVLPVAIGTGGGVTDITWNKTTAKNVPIHSLNDIRNIILDLSNGEHKVTFIKCDIEGFEWYLKGSEFDGIRRIEMEIHPLDFPTEKINPDLLPYLKNNWDVRFTEDDRFSYILHAKPKQEVKL